MSLISGLIVGLNGGLGFGDPVGAGTAMTVTIADSSDPLTGGTNVTYTIQPTTTGAAGATSVTCTITLDASLSWVSSSGAGWAFGRVGQVVTAQLNMMPVGAATPIVIVAGAPNANATITTTVTLTATNAAQANDSEVTTVVVAGGDGPGGLIMTPTSGAAFLALTGRTPRNIYPCQDASGNLVDTVGAMNLIANAAPLYTQAVAGWTRVGVGFNQTAAQRFAVATGVGPNPGATPVAMLAYCTFRTPAAVREVFYIEDAGAAVKVAVLCTAGGLLRSQCIATTNDGTVDHRDTLVHPVLLTIDTAATTINRYSDLEKDNGTYAATPADAPKGLGAAAGATSWLGECVYFVILEGANAQFTDAQAKTFLQSFGWTIPWT